MTPMFIRSKIATGGGDGLTRMEIVGRLPKGGRLVLTLDEIPHHMLKQFVRDGLKALQLRRDRALIDINEMIRVAHE